GHGAEGLEGHVPDGGVGVPVGGHGPDDREVTAVDRDGVTGGDLEVGGDVAGQQHLVLGRDGGQAGRDLTVGIDAEQASEVTAESVSIRIWPTETGSVSIPEVSSQMAAWSVSTCESDQEMSSPRVGVSTIRSAG